MFSLIRVAAVGAIFVLAAAVVSMSSTSASNQTEKALKTKLELNGMAELMAIESATAPAAKVGIDAWGGPMYLMPVCTGTDVASMNTVVLVGLSGGAPKKLSDTLSAAVLGTDGALKTSSFATACLGKDATGGWLAGGAVALGFPLMSDLSDLVQLYTYEDVLRLSGNTNASGAVRARNSAALSAKVRTSYAFRGAVDGELRFFAAEQLIYYWQASNLTWVPLQGDGSTVKGRCKPGRVYVPLTEYSYTSVEPAFCFSEGEVFVPTKAADSLDPDTTQYLAGGLGTPQPYADIRIKLENSAKGGDPVHVTPTMATYNEARAYCESLGETLMTGAQLEALTLQTGQNIFSGYQPMPASLAGTAGNPCKGTNSGYNLCAVDLTGPTGAVSFYGSSQQRTQELGTGTSKQLIWDLGGNLAEWIWSGPGPLADTESATILGKGYYQRESGGAYTDTWLSTPGLGATSPLSRAGFRCTYRAK